LSFEVKAKGRPLQGEGHNFCPQSVVLDALRKILQSLYYLPTLSNCPVKLEVITDWTEIPAAVSACVWCGKQHISDELTCENI